MKITLYIKENHSFRSNYRPQHTSLQKTAQENLPQIHFLYSFHPLCLFFISFIIYDLYIYFAFAWNLSIIMLDSKSQTQNMWSLIVDRSTYVPTYGRTGVISINVNRPLSPPMRCVRSFPAKESIHRHRRCSSLGLYRTQTLEKQNRNLERHTF